MYGSELGGFVTFMGQGSRSSYIQDLKSLSGPHSIMSIINFQF